MFVLYGLAYAPLDIALGRQAGIFVTIPMLVTAWLFGVRGGLAASLASLPLNLVLVLLLTDRAWREWIVQGGGAGYGAEVLVALVVGRLSDLSEKAKGELARRERAEAKLLSSATRLERSNRELEEFAYLAAHDLQDPLRKISTFGDRLYTDHAAALGDEGSDYVQRMQNAALRLSALIRDLLQLSRVTTRGQPFVHVDLMDVAQDAVTDLESVIVEAGGRVEIANVPVVKADPLQMRQLLNHLIGNGVKFRRPGVTPIVRVGGKPTNGHRNGAVEADDRSGWDISVEDNGMGFDEKYLDRIFTVFQRLHDGNGYDGTGVGLTVCRKIAERHGGTITATSTIGKGTVFTVSLPRDPGQGAER